MCEEIRRVWLVAFLFATAIALVPAQAQVVDQAVVSSITSTSVALCGDFSRVGKSQSLDIGGVGRAQLQSLADEVGPISLEGNGRVTIEQYSGVLAEQLGAELKDWRDCNQEVFRILIGIIGPNILVKPRKSDAVKVKYFTKQPEYLIVSAAIKEVLSGYTSDALVYSEPGGENETPTNIVYCSAGTPIALVKGLALALHDAGISIYNITSRSDLYRQINIEGTDVRRYLPMTRDQISSVSSCVNRPFNKRIYPITVENQCRYSVDAYVSYQLGGSPSRVFSVVGIDPGETAYVRRSNGSKVEVEGEAIYYYAHIPGVNYSWCDCNTSGRMDIYVPRLGTEEAFRTQHGSSIYLQCDNLR